MRIGRQHVDARILSFLRAAGGVGVSGSDLAGRLGISRAAVWARIEELRRLGFEITAGPHKGYQLLGAPDRLIADDIISRLGRVHMIGGDVHVFRETNSTNDLAERLARDGAQTGTVVFAESQNKGRGRLGRNWHSPAEKGLWFSLVQRAKLRPQEATRLTITA
ncbi:MAG: HTH domain-containing protein, partial [Verrucomicrobia bacterium]|nr:HTH domain-containing protein [Verrucomicrobiota bacterium]